MSCHDIDLDQTMPNVELQAISIYYNMTSLIDQIIFQIITGTPANRHADRQIDGHEYTITFAIHKLHYGRDYFHSSSLYTAS